MTPSPAPARQAPAQQEAPSVPVRGTSARPKGRLRTVLGWIVVVALVLVVALVSWRIAATSPSSRGALDPEGSNDVGSLALAELLRKQGVDVTVVRDRAAAAAAIDDDSTLAMSDPYALSDEAVQDLIADADSVVFLSSSARVLRLLELGENASGGALGEALADGCSRPEFAKVGEIRPGRLFVPAAGTDGCFTDDAGNAAVLVREENGTRIALVEGSTLFSNDALDEDGDAALGLALLGQRSHLVWYVPSSSDSDIQGADPEDTLAALTPEWLSPAIVLLLLAGVAAAIWRGRRFGPLVSETLPVTVRASETMLGRARLTAKAADAAHAAAALRTGTTKRLATRLGLAASAPAADVADAAADRLHIARGSLHGLLVGPLPAHDAELIEAARRLAELETAVDAAVRVERNTP